MSSIDTTTTRTSTASFPLPSTLVSTLREDHEAHNWLPVFTKESAKSSLFSQQSSFDPNVIPTTSLEQVDELSSRSIMSGWLAEASKNLPDSNQKKLEAARDDLAYRWASVSFTMNRQAVGVASQSSPVIDIQATVDRYNKASTILKNQEDKPIVDVLKEHKTFLRSIRPEPQGDRI
jgi:hypothetical protein